MKSIRRYFYNSWIQACGEGWTRTQVSASYVFSVLFAGSVILYSYVANLGWSGIQIIAAAWIAWDLGGGLIGYSHQAIKRKTGIETSKLHFYHHNFLHIHPLILIFFQSQAILLGLTLLHIIGFFIYVELLEVDPKTGLRKIGRKGEMGVVILEIGIAIALIALSFWIEDSKHSFQVFGIAIYCLLILTTLILVHIPISFQRTASVMMVAFLIMTGVFLQVPDGFEWFIPVYFLKLLSGYTAKEQDGFKNSFVE